ncbi:PRC-barrel domain-containing protein [Candidatus Saccharibacteria bacterium]|nr:PRC-barrel domain-containing protein [Candidatus Saccharibacteria bacterium]
MLINASKLIGYPVLSLHVGGEIARAEELVVAPASLKVIGFHVGGPAVKNDPEIGEFLETRDVREFAEIGMIVDSSEVFVNPNDVKKLADVLSLNFSLIGLKVESKKGSKLGKVVDFIVETETFLVRQLIVKRPAIKALIDPELIIPRKEIVEITDYKVIVKDEEEKIRVKALREDFSPNFVNPFREPDFSNRRVVREKSDE